MIESLGKFDRQKKRVTKRERERERERDSHGNGGREREREGAPRSRPSRTLAQHRRPDARSSSQTGPGTGILKLPATTAAPGTSGQAGRLGRHSRRHPGTARSRLLRPGVTDVSHVTSPSRANPGRPITPGHGVRRELVRACRRPQPIPS